MLAVLCRDKRPPLLRCQDKKQQTRRELMLDATLSIAAVTATNALLMTVGSF
jgi:hypothetical protein